LVTSRAALAGTDNLDWGDLGPENTEVPSPFLITSDDGLLVDVRQTDGSFLRVNQGSGFSGNFAPGDELLATNFPPLGAFGPITLNFGSTALQAFGLQIQASRFGPFTAELEVFDSGGASLGSVSRAGVSNSNGDNSAIFIGVASDDPSTDFHSLIVRLTAATLFPEDFAVNQADFTPALAPDAVPLPGGFVIWVLTFATAGLRLARRQTCIRAQ
jgi:hypothetical protein